MEHEGSAFLFGMPSSSSPIPPTTVAQPQNSHSIEMSEIPLDQNHPTKIFPNVQYFIVIIILINTFVLIISFLIPCISPLIIVTNGINLVVFPNILALSLYVCLEIFSERYKGKCVRLKWLVIIMIAPLMVLLGICIFPATLLLFSCLLVLFLVARLLQFIRHGEAYDNITLLKFCIRTWMCILYLYSIAPTIAVILAVWNAPSLKNTLVFGIMHLDWQVITWKITSMLTFGITFSTCAFFYIPRIQFDPVGSWINVPEAVLEIADCVNAIACLYQVLPYIPDTFKNLKMYGLQISTWVTILVIIVIINNAIGLIIHVLVCFFKKKFHDKKSNNNNAKPENYSILENFLRKKYLMYWANGLKHYATFLLSSLLFLLVWVLYLGHELNGTPKPKHFWVFGTRTCLSFTTCAILWFIKRCILLSWEAESIYDRLESKILQGGRHLYFLGILGRHKYDMFKLLYDSDIPERNHDMSFWNNLSNYMKYMISLSLGVNMNLNYASLKHDTADEWISGKYLSKVKMKNAKEYLLDDGIPTTFGIQQAASYFLMAHNKLLEDKYADVLLEVLESYNQDDSHGRITEKILKQIIGEDNWRDFQLLLDGNTLDSSEAISLQTKFKAWMDMAHKNCLFLANTLKSSREVVDCLNKIISVFIIFTSFLMWLLLTGLATTKVLVLIATPILGLSFIFQDTCKTLFEGVMFAYVVNPFNVGDLCILDGTMMEVKAVGVWRTLFDKVATQEEVIYTNSELITKSIINHRTEFDWNDNLELDLGSLDKEKINHVKQQLEKYIGDNEDKFILGITCIEVLTCGEKMSMKLVINFKHRVNVRINSYFECLKKKRSLRSEFVLHAEDIVNQKKNEGSSNSD
ncbi:mechanosensitive ion channel protein 10-like isoform X2 [Amaranthus tricolor]|uniref:mechanosensitive ion channel protein 10-like isoform X2 n=1 Tax=Amaranthus tricolor TaxID=29722 RepID=UPI002590D337|nr:mechanosensitive ion channel protein 10-like isoform X2 [Amaranthus tricolor]